MVAREVGEAALTKATLRAAAIGGVLGGVMMAVWLMFILWLTGIGFWTLLNLITNTFWRSVPLDAKFNLWAVIIGLVAHVVVSFIFGSLIALAAWLLPGSRSLIIASGALFGPVIWVVMQYGIWRAVDPAAAQIITPWVFAVAHLIFGVLAATVAAIVTTDEKAAARSTHVMADAEDTSAFTARHTTVREAIRSTLPAGGYGPGLAGGAAAEIPPPRPAQPAPHRPQPVPHRRRLTARNDGGMRTAVYTSGGPGMVTDEPVAFGGNGTGLTPLETVLGALCGSIGATFATVAREAGFFYGGIDFEASFAADPRGLAGAPGLPPYFQLVRVQAQVRATRPDPRMPEIARLTERRCAVRNLLADAGVTVDLTWNAVPPQGASAAAPDTPGVPRHPAS
jgi:uncharacterized OsmC-like protein